MISNIQKQKGAMYIAIIISSILLLVGTLGFIFWQNFVKSDQVVEQEAGTSAPRNEPAEPDELLTKQDTSIHSVDIKLQTSGDITLLPEYTPASFRSHMQELLSGNISGQGMFDCGTVVLQYQISRISQVNIEGGVVPVNEQGETCSGGAPAIWVLTPAGTWDEETLNGVVCSSKNGGAVYEEFAPECSENGSTFVKNPNGSIPK
jgi:hypothetical protein